MIGRCQKLKQDAHELFVVEQFISGQLVALRVFDGQTVQNLQIVSDSECFQIIPH